MGAFRSVVKLAQSSSKERAPATSNKIVTAPNIATLLRPIIGAYVGYRLATGKKKNLGWAFGAAITDNEGIIARLWDKLFPTSGRGVTIAGEGGDPVADTAMLGEFAVGVLASPHVSLLGKLGVAIVGVQEGIKAAWAIDANHRYHEITGERLQMPPNDDGKEAMVEKMTAGGTAIWSGDVESPVVKTGLGLLSLGLAISGARRGHREFVDNIRPTGEAIIAAAQAAADQANMMELGPAY